MCVNVRLQVVKYQSFIAVPDNLYNKLTKPTTITTSGICIYNTRRCQSHCPSTTCRPSSQPSSPPSLTSSRNLPWLLLRQPIHLLHSSSIQIYYILYIVYLYYFITSFGWASNSQLTFTIMSTRKRKQDDEELVALPSDESEEEEEYVFLSHRRDSLLDLSLKYPIECEWVVYSFAIIVYCKIAIVDW